MKKNYILLSITANLVFYAICLTASAQPAFQKYFSDITEYQELSRSTFDDSYVIASSTRDQVGYYDFSAVKINKSGQIIWSKTFPSPSDDYLTSLFITPSGDMLLGGYKINSDGNFDFSLMRINASGTLLWYKTYGTGGADFSVFTGANSLGDIYLTGNIDNNGVKSVWVLKLNNSGTVFWSKMYAVNDVYASALTSDGGIALIGNGYFTKINPAGAAVFTTNIKFEALGVATLKQISDEGFIFSCKIPYCVQDQCSSSFALMKIDPTGKVLWSKNTTCLGRGEDVIETSDGGFVFIGQLYNAPGTIGAKFVSIKTDDKGNHLWTKAYGRVDSYGEYACTEPAADGGFMLLGVEDSKALLIKTDASGSTSCNEKIITPLFVNMNLVSVTTTLTEKNETTTDATPVCTEAVIELTDSILCSPATGMNEFSHGGECILYPIPFSESITVEIRNHNISTIGLEFNMYDIFGRKLMQLPVSNHRLLISRGNIPGGMYFYEVRNRGEIIDKGKIIAE